MDKEKEARFWSCVDVRHKRECWLWRAGTFSSGYGAFGHERAHRVAWKLWGGKIPEGLLILHRCNRALCVNPYHLYIGNVRDNTNDRVRSGNQVKGESHHAHKITESQVREIRAFAASWQRRFPRYYTMLGRKYGLNRTTVSAIVNRKIWRHVKEAPDGT